VCCLFTRVTGLPGKPDGWVCVSLLCNDKEGFKFLFWHVEEVRKWSWQCQSATHFSISLSPLDDPISTATDLVVLYYYVGLLGEWIMEEGTFELHLFIYFRILILYSIGKGGSMQ
jgi:hypothetical protein